MRWSPPGEVAPAGRALRAGRRLPAWGLAAVLAALYLVLDPPSADLAAQTYRTWLFDHAPWSVWDGGWYGGHHTPAYSVLFPPLASVLGPRVVGALSAVAAAWAAERLLRATGAPGARAAALWFASATAVSLVTGRLTFALGLALGAGALMALAHGRRVAAVALAALTSLGSPVAGAFLALLVVAWAAGEPRRRWPTALALVVAATLPAALLALAFPEGGDFPFVPSAFWPTLAGTLLVLAVLPREARVLRAGVVLYALVLVVSFALPTPMGGNAVRLGALLAGPVAALVLWPGRRRVLLLLAPALLYWAWQTPVDDWARASGDRSTAAAYYAGVARFLAARPPARVEVPFTDQHWEASQLARHAPLARGWERQLDRDVNPLFYEGTLTPARFRAWLGENAVGYVALADAPIDYSAATEARLVRDGLPYLREVYRDAHWRVFAVTGATPLATGARVRRIGIDDVELDAPHAGRVLVRVRWTPYWRITTGRGCVRPAGEWTALDLEAAGRVRMSADFALSRVRARSPRCTR